MSNATASRQFPPPPLPPNVQAILAATANKEQLLANINPYFIDLSLRENPFGSRLGQTLHDKQMIYPMLREFGFKNILVGTLDYFMPEVPEVDDSFMEWLSSTGQPTDGNFAFTDIGIVPTEGFNPSIAMQKMAQFKVPNTLHEIYLSVEGMKSMHYDIGTVMRSLPVSVQWILDNCVGDFGTQRPRIIVNIVDGCDAFAENPAQVCEVLTLLATLPIEGVSFEDDRGTFMPFQVGAYVAIARHYLPPPLKLLVHMHSGGGFENASVIEALLNGADGVWGGLPKRAAIIGHASLGELMANLMRIGNTNIPSTYVTNQLLTVTTNLQSEDDDLPLPEDLPILGANAYRITLDFFQQIDGRYMDLPAEKIGGTLGYRICPLASNQPVLAGRLAEIYNYSIDWFLNQPTVLTQMVVCMRGDLCNNIRTAYDDPPNATALFLRAGGTPPPTRSA